MERIKGGGALGLLLVILASTGCLEAEGTRCNDLVCAEGAICYDATGECVDPMICIPTEVCVLSRIDSS